MTAIPFATQAYKLDQLPVSAQETTNCYAEREPLDAKTSVAVFGVPGLTPLYSVGDGPIRGFCMMGGTLYVVSGDSLYGVEGDGTTTFLGSGISTTVIPITAAGGVPSGDSGSGGDSGGGGGGDPPPVYLPGTAGAAGGGVGGGAGGAGGAIGLAGTAGSAGTGTGAGAGGAAGAPGLDGSPGAAGSGGAGGAGGIGGGPGGGGGGGGGGGSGNVDFTLRTTAASTGDVSTILATITVPGDAQVDDLAVLVHCAYAQDAAGRAFISNDTDPSGWSALSGGHDVASFTNGYAAIRVNYKKLVAGDIGATVTIMSGAGVDASFRRAYMWVITPGGVATPTYTPGTWAVDADTGNPASQTTIHSGATPQAMFGFACGPFGSSGAFSTQTPAFGATATTGARIAGITLYPSGGTPVDQITDMADLGLVNFLASGRFVVS